MRTRHSTALAIIVAGLLVSGTLVVTAGPTESPDPPGTGDGAVTATIGPRTPEMPFVALDQPCRIVDTRAAGGPLIVGTGRHFQADATNLSSQGGSSSGCSIPTHAAALATNMTAISASSAGFLRAKPFDGNFTMPNATLLNYNSSLNVSNGVVVPLTPGSSGGADFEFSVLTFGNSTGLVIDVIGYYALPFYAVVNQAGSFLAQNRFASSSRTGPGVYQLTAASGEDIRGCSIQASFGSSDNSESISFDGDEILVDGDSDRVVEIYMFDENGVAADFDFIVIVNC